MSDSAKPKAWQIVVLAVGAIALAASLFMYFTREDKLDLPNRVFLADVSTGEVFEASTKVRPAITPEANPTTGKLTLVRVRKDEQGKWKLNQTDMRNLEEGIDRSAVNGEELVFKSGPVKLELKVPGK